MTTFVRIEDPHAYVDTSHIIAITLKAGAREGHGHPRILTTNGDYWHLTSAPVDNAHGQAIVDALIAALAKRAPAGNVIDTAAIVRGLDAKAAAVRHGSVVISGLDS
jgi:hypothetical protein